MDLNNGKISDEKYREMCKMRMQDREVRMRRKEEEKREKRLVQTMKKMNAGRRKVGLSSCYVVKGKRLELRD